MTRTNKRTNQQTGRRAHGLVSLLIPIRDRTPAYFIICRRYYLPGNMKCQGSTQTSLRLFQGRWWGLHQHHGLCQGLWMQPHCLPQERLGCSIYVHSPILSGIQIWLQDQLQGVQEKLCFFTILYNPSFVYISLQETFEVWPFLYNE